MAGTVPASAPSGSAVALTPTVTTVTLPTGDQVTVTTNPAGQSTYALNPVAGGGQAFQSYQGANGDHYIVPAVALPYLNQGLDPSLFDVTALAHDAAADGGQIPVDLSFAAGVTPTAPAGVTVTSVSGGQEQGYLTASSGTAFAAALRAQIGADVAAGKQPGATPLFGGLTSMSVAGSAVTPVTPGVPAQPDYALSILQINVNELPGQATTFAYIELYNTDSFSRELVTVPVVDGIARIAVPAGDYGIYSEFFDYDAQGELTAARQVTLSDFTVAATGVTTVSLDESSATSPVSVTTPRPSTQDLEGLFYVRQDAAGDLLPLEFAVLGAIPTYVAPQPAARVGAIHFMAQLGATSPSASDGYRYDLSFGSDQVPANEAYVAKPSQIATVHEEFSSDPAVSTQFPSLFDLAAFDSYVGSGTLINPPGDQPVLPSSLTDYLGTADGGGWQQALETSSGMGELGDADTYTGGHTYTVDWAHGPLAPGIGQHTGPQDCQACSAGTALSLIFNAVDDSDPSHVGSYYQTTSHLTLYQDGNQLYSGGGTGVGVTGIPATPTTYRAVLDTSLGGGLSQSTQTHTDLTVPYTPQAAAGSALPSSDGCYGPGQPAGTQCAVLPVLNLDYHLVSDEDNTSSAPIQRMNLTVGHVSYDGAGSHARITSAAVSVSFDGGTTWKPAIVAGVNGQYVAVWANPASARGTDPELKVSATDAAGGSITQTVTNAYSIATPAS